MRGQVVALHRKPETPGEHGLPKPSTGEIEIGPNGVVGDFNRYRHEETHDDPTSAVLLMTVENLDALRAEGWPIRAGDLGENVTTRGIPYSGLPMGARVRVGAAELEVTRPCDPCTNLHALPYVGKGRGPAFVKTMMGRRGWYCAVVHPGRVRLGDEVEVRTPTRPRA